MKVARLTALLVCFGACPALAWPGPTTFPEHRLLFSSLTVLRMNPSGLETQDRLTYQRRLYQSDSAAFRENYLGAGLFARLGPASARLSAHVDVQPATFLQLRFVGEMFQYFGTAGYRQSFASATAVYSDTVLARREEEGLNVSGWGYQLAFEPLVQVKVGPIAVRSRMSLGMWKMPLPAGDRVWYEATLDTLIPGDGLTISNDLDVLYLTERGLMIGSRFSVVHPIYSAAQLQPGESAADAPNGHSRVGLLAAYTFFDDGFTRFNKPSVLVIASWYLSHRWRTGADVSQGKPYILVGFAFQSDLLERPL